MPTPPPGYNDLEIRFSDAERAIVTAEAERLGLNESGVIRQALTAYFKLQGREIMFDDVQRGGKRERISEQDLFNEFMTAWSDAGGEAPVTEYPVGNLRLDAAWPDAQVGFSMSDIEAPAGWSIVTFNRKEARRAIPRAVRQLQDVLARAGQLS